MCVHVHWLKNYHRHVGIKVSEIILCTCMVKNVPEHQKVIDVHVSNISVGSCINGRGCLSPT